MSRPRVLYVSKALAVAEYRRKLRALSENVRVTALVPERWGGAIEPLDGGHAPAEIVLRRPVFHGHNHFHLYPRVGRVLERADPHLVHIDEEPFSAITFQLALLCRHRGIPSLFFAWENLDKWIPPPFGGLRRRVYAWVDGAIAGTEAAANVLRTTGYEGPIEVIPQFGVDPQRFRPATDLRHSLRSELGAGDGEFIVGFGGALTRQKGVDVLLRAAGGVEGCRVVLLGAGPEERRLRELAGELSLNGRLRFQGSVPSRRMAEWLPAFDTLVLPSRTTPRLAEQFGRILVEAMACGVPVVGSDSGEIPEVIGEVGIVVPEEEPRALTRALCELRDNAERRERLGRAGRQRVQDHFTHEEIARKTGIFYRRILQERGGAG